MNGIVKISGIIVVSMLLFINGCNLFGNDALRDYGHCSEELFDQLKNANSLKVYAVYNIEYSSPNELDENENQVQQEIIADMHENLLNNMEEMNISGVNKSTIGPWISMFVDEEALEFLCTSDLVQNVQEVNTYSTH